MADIGKEIEEIEFDSPFAPAETPIEVPASPVEAPEPVLEPV